MRYAIATQDGRTICTHGGRTRLFLLFQVDSDAGPGAEPRAVGRLELEPDMVLHHHGDGKPHPIDWAQVLIVGTSGQGFVNHMRRRGIEPVRTAEPDPVQAIRDHMAGTVKPAAAPEHPHDHHEHGDHGHDHHGHDHHGHGEEAKGCCGG